MNLLMYLKKNQKNQVQFAAELGMSKQMLNARINGKTQWKAEEIQTIQQKTRFEVDLNDLLVISKKNRSN